MLNLLTLHNREECTQYILLPYYSALSCIKYTIACLKSPGVSSSWNSKQRYTPPDPPPRNGYRYWWLAMNKMTPSALRRWCTSSCNAKAGCVHAWDALTVKITRSPMAAQQRGEVLYYLSTVLTYFLFWHSRLHMLVVHWIKPLFGVLDCWIWTLWNHSE